MDIAKLSTDMATLKTDSAHGMKMMKKALEQVETTGQNIIDMIDSVSTPAINDGKSLDIRI